MYQPIPVSVFNPTYDMQPLADCRRQSDMWVEKGTSLDVLKDMMLWCCALIDQREISFCHFTIMVRISNFRRTTASGSRV